MRILLYPFSVLFGWAVYLRNLLFDSGLLEVRKYDVPLISVGNLRVGGTGKSPFIEYLTQLLVSKGPVAILSRGYGRKTKGLIEANQPDAEAIGDEPAQFKRKFPLVRVVASESRRKGIAFLIASGGGTPPIILMDDAFQHRKVKAGLSLVLFEAADLNSCPLLLPAGDFREPLYALRRADAVVITKVVSLPDRDFALATAKKLRLTRQPLFFSSVSYLSPVSFYDSSRVIPTIENTVIHLLTAIVNPQPLIDYLKKCGNTLVHHSFADHHRFRRTEIQALIKSFHKSSAKLLLTTEKDAERLRTKEIATELGNLPIYVIPITVKVTGFDLPFDTFILNNIARLKALGE